VTAVTRNFIQNTRTEVEYRPDIFRVVRGANTLKYTKVGRAIKNYDEFSFEMVQTQGPYNVQISK